MRERKIMKNQILERRICQLISQTFAVPLDDVMQEVVLFGVEAVIEKLENNRPISYSN